MTTATPKQVRDYYKAHGYEVRISKDGRVSYRPSESTGPVKARWAWFEGRFVSEYRVIDGQVVLR